MDYIINGLIYKIDKSCEKSFSSKIPYIQGMMRWNRIFHFIVNPLDFNKDDKE